MNDAAKVQPFFELCKFLCWENSWENGKKNARLSTCALNEEDYKIRQKDGSRDYKERRAWQSQW